MKQFISEDEAVPAERQHSKPCADCPWSRKSIRGWLGDMTREEWLQTAHGEGQIFCHTLLGAQCAGAAIYRTNMCKRVRDPGALRLPVDRERVFATHIEFMDHHDRKKAYAKKDGK